MALLTSTPTGNVWPGELEVGRIDAPAVQLSVDPTLPVLGYDTRFPTDQIVIGRGRLVGLKSNSTDTGSAITQVPNHVNYLTVADGVNVAPLGYADQAIYRDWANKSESAMPKISRNYMIAVPYVTGVNSLYGTLGQGDKITALKSVDPRLTGSIVKYVARQVVQLTGITATAGATTIPAALPQPVCLMGTKTTANVVDPDLTWTKVAGYWNVLSGSGVVDTILVSYGFGAEMIAGEVYSLEGNTDLPGFLKWVTDNFGAWNVDPMFAALGNDKTAVTGAVLTTKGGGYYSVAGDPRIDPAKAITFKVTSGAAIYAFVDGVYTDDLAGTTLLKSQSYGSDNTQGQLYTVDPATGLTQLVRLFSDQAGTVMTESDVDGRITVDYTPVNFSPQPAFGVGLVGNSPLGIPSQYAKDPITGAAAIGVLKVAIH